MAIDFPDLPGAAYQISGNPFITAWHLNYATGVESKVMTYLWSADFRDNILKIFNDPMQSIISLMRIPYPVSAFNSHNAKFRLGNTIPAIHGESITSRMIDNQFERITFGSVTVPEEYASYMDYDATDVQIYLPYIGFRHLDTDYVMGKTLSLVYTLDTTTGACVAMIKSGVNHIYSFPGNCGVQIPLSGADYKNLYNNLMSMATGAMTLGAGDAVNEAANLAGGMFKSSVNTRTLGTLTGSVALMDQQTPFIIVTRPRVILPPEQAAISGYPIFTSSVLSDFHGFTRIREVHLENLNATKTELDEIERLLKEGVILPDE